jgi:tetratricopeptide (TPR) repeat protein
LRDERVRAGLSQRALASSGCTAAYVSRLEAGERTASLQLLRAFAERLGVSVEYLATGRELDETDELVEAEVALRLGDLAEAQRLYEHVLAHTARREESASAEAGLGRVALSRDAVERAIEHLERALELYGDANFDHPDVADALGRAYATCGRLEDAIALFERWLSAVRERRDDVEVVRFEILLANALIDAASFGRASELLADALVLSRECADPLTRARMFWSQSRLHALQKNSKLAARYARQALEILQSTELTTYTARAHQLLAYVELERGNADEALRLLRDGRELLGDSASELERMKFQLEEARALVETGDLESAGALAMETLSLLNAIDPQDAGRGYLVLAGVFKELGDLARARELYELAIDILEQHGLPYLVDAYSGLSDLLKHEGKTEEALEVLEKALSRAQAPGRIGA